jgi:glyceraldehyde 3-phosphate dehydrogenase
MTITIGINGFGRIGRVFLRQLYATGANAQIKVAAINDLTDATTLAHLLKYDSVHRKFNGTISHDEKSITVNGDKIAITAEKDPAKLPWKDLGVDIVIESTGIFTKKEKAALHLQAGAKKVIVSAPSPDPDITIAYGVNHTTFDATKHNIISCASCTTNCLAPMAKVILENFGIVRGTMTTIHSYTNDQNILDLPHKDLRRARAAGLSMIPTTTGAAKALGLVIPELNGKIDGFSVRVPTPDVSLTDFVCEVSKPTTVAEVNAALKKASETTLQGVLGYSDEPLVSMDYLGNPHSSIIDAQSTMVIDGKLLKVVSWYDNETGFSTRMVDVIKLISKGM